MKKSQKNSESLGRRAGHELDPSISGFESRTLQSLIGY